MNETSIIQPFTESKQADLHPVVRIAILLFSLIGLLCVLGFFALEAADSRLLLLFHFDRELNIVTAFSSLLLLCGGLLSARTIQLGIHSKRAAGGITILLFFMAFDESLKIHETSEKLVGIDWQILYLPVFLFAGFSWLILWWKRDRTFRWLWVAGASAWVISQLLEAVQWGWSAGTTEGPAANYDTLMMWEEILEMSGSTFFVLALYHALVSHSTSQGQNSNREDIEARI